VSRDKESQAPQPSFISQRLGGTSRVYVKRRKVPLMTLTAKISRDLVARLDAAIGFAKDHAPALGVTRSAIVASALLRYLADLEKIEMRVHLNSIPQTEESNHE
jgi:hypothetical protein